MKQLVILSICALFLSATVCLAQDKASSGYGIGDTAEDFNLMNIDGEFVSMADYEEANGYIIVFTCNHCPYAVMYEDRLVELNKKYEPLGYPVIAIMPNDPEVKPGDSFDNMKVRAAEKGFTFPYLMDEGQKLYPIFGAKKTPHVYLLDAAKVVRYIGSIDDSAKDASEVEEKFLENAIDALMKGNTPDPAVTKAIGCSIKTKS